MLIYIVNVLIYIVNTKKCVDLHSKYEGKSIQIYANHIITEILENISHFFTFWDGFFMDFQNVWCSVKRTCPLLIRILYLFMKCASKCSIIEIYRNEQKKCITIECGLQNGTLAIFVATSIFGGGMYVIPAATYSLIMFVTSLIFVYLVRKNI